MPEVVTLPKLSKERWYELVAKADWEGGWAEYLLGYMGGAVPADLDADPDLQDAIKNLGHAWTVVDSYLHKYFDEYGEYE